MRGLAGKTALVTGGGSGLGAACAARLAAEGVSVTVAGLRADAAERIASLLEPGQPTITASRLLETAQASP